MTPQLFVRHWDSWVAHESPLGQYQNLIGSVPCAVMSEQAVMQRLAKYVSLGLRYTDVIQGHQPYREISDAICRNIRDHKIEEGVLMLDWVVFRPNRDPDQDDDEIIVAQLVLDIEDIIRMSEQEYQP